MRILVTESFLVQISNLLPHISYPNLLKNIHCLECQFWITVYILKHPTSSHHVLCDWTGCTAYNIIYLKWKHRIQWLIIIKLLYQAKWARNSLASLADQRHHCRRHNHAVFLYAPSPDFRTRLNARPWSTNMSLPYLTLNKDVLQVSRCHSSYQTNSK